MNGDSERSIIGNLLGYFHREPRFLITSHARPDGDAVGSVLALGLLLEQLGCSVDMVLAGPVPEVFHSLPHFSSIRISKDAGSETCPVVLLECSSTERTGISGFGNRVLLNIDHHSSGREFASVNWIDPNACAVAVMLYRIASQDSDLTITDDVATCLYTALLTDTGGFTYSSTNAEAFAIAHDLTTKGANPGLIAQNVFFSNPLSRLRVLGMALAKMRRENAIAWTSISDRELREAGATSEDCEGIVNQLVGVAGIKAAAFFRELDNPNEIRLSMRSKGEVDVAQVAERFGGGGHRNASGVTLSGNLEQVAKSVLEELSGATQMA